jgi:GTP-binding protein
LEQVVDAHPAPLGPGGRPVRLYYIAQVGSGPPTFSIACNRPQAVTDDYKRFLVNRMREAFGLKVPIIILLKERTKKRFVPKHHR